jgi:hypothetical protein
VGLFCKVVFCQGAPDFLRAAAGLASTASSGSSRDGNSVWAVGRGTRRLAHAMPPLPSRNSVGGHAIATARQLKCARSRHRRSARGVCTGRDIRLELDFLLWSARAATAPLSPRAMTKCPDILNRLRLAGSGDHCRRWGKILVDPDRSRFGRLGRFPGLDHR